MIANQFGQDLKEFAKQLRPEDFRLIAEPLALGRFEQKKLEIAVQGVVSQPQTEPQKISHADSFSITAQSQVKTQVKVPSTQTAPCSKPSWLRLFFIHCVDLIVVATSIFLALVCSLYFLLQDQPKWDASTILLNPSVQKILQLNIVHVFAGFYGIYLFYVLFFYLFSTRTIGSSLLSPRNSM